jgi:hypothetical protein
MERERNAIEKKRNEKKETIEEKDSLYYDVQVADEYKIYSSTVTLPTMFECASV